MSSQPLTETPLEVGKYVRTPSGAIVKLLELYAMSDGAVEALVEYASRERARFRVKHIRPLP